MNHGLYYREYNNVFSKTALLVCIYREAFIKPSPVITLCTALETVKENLQFIC